MIGSALSQTAWRAATRLSPRDPNSRILFGPIFGHVTSSKRDSRDGQSQACNTKRSSGCAGASDVAQPVAVQAYMARGF